MENIQNVSIDINKSSLEASIEDQEVVLSGFIKLTITLTKEDDTLAKINDIIDSRFEDINYRISNLENIINKHIDTPEDDNKIEMHMSNNIIKAKVNDTKNIIPIFYPIDIKDKTLTWSSTDTNVAVVDQEGLVTMKGLGKCKIEAKHNTTGNIVECAIEVIDQTVEEIGENYDKYNSTGVMLNTTNVILTPDNINYDITYKETPLGTNNGVSFKSSDINVATVNNEGRITGVRPGTCTITAKNNKGGFPIECKVVFIDNINIGTRIDEIIGETHTEKLFNIFSSETEVSGNSNSYNVSSLYASINNNLIIRNATFIGNDAKNMLAISASNNTLEFINCTFINVGISLNNYEGNLKLENCIFKQWQYCPIDIHTDNVTLDIINCTFKDNKPNEDEWIANQNWEKFWAYNPINIYGNNITTKIVGNTFNNIMSRCVVYIKDKYRECKIEVTDNTFYRTEGHVINIESATSGFVENNYFYLIGDLRNTIGNSDEGFGVGGNCVFAHNNYAPYCDLVVKNNIIRYTMENAIEGGLKEVAYNYVEYTGYRYKEGIDNSSMEGIWGSARSGIHHNVIINPNMDGIRLQNFGLANNIPCNVYNNIILYNNDKESKLLKNTGISAVSTKGSDSGVNAYKNTIIGFENISKIDEVVTNVDFNLQTSCEYAYHNKM